MRFSEKNKHSSSDLISLSLIQRGQKAIIVEIHGGFVFTKRLADIGVREGKEITKVCDQPLHGPVQIKVDNTEIALGRNMSERILVKLIETLTCET